MKQIIINRNEFVEEIRKITLDPREKLASLDISDMFNNIPVTRAVDIAIMRIDQSDAFKDSMMNKTDLKQIILIALNNSYGEFNGKVYKQRRGLPVGNCLSPLLSDLYLDDYLEKHLSDIKKDDHLWCYIDDILLITTMTEQELDERVGHLNSINSTIRFTLEFQKNDRISFLDTTLHQNMEKKKDRDEMVPQGNRIRSDAQLPLLSQQKCETEYHQEHDISHHQHHREHLTSERRSRDTHQNVNQLELS